VNPAFCVILVPVADSIAPECEHALDELERRGYPVRRIQIAEPIDLARCTMARDALAAGFDELMWVDPDIVFNPDDVDKLRRHNLPIACGMYPKSGKRELACALLPETGQIRFGVAGGLLEILHAGFGFALTRRAVFDEIHKQSDLAERDQPSGPPLVPYFLPTVVEHPTQGLLYLPEDFAFCERARRCGFRVMADTSVRLWNMGRYAYGWEDAGSDKERFTDYQFHFPTAQPAVAATPVPAAPIADPHSRATLPRNLLRGTTEPLRHGFPKFKAYFFSYIANRESLALSLESFRQSDWGEEPPVFMQPEDWPTGMDSASRNYKRIMDAALADDCDFALILEDDVRVNRRLRRNLSAISLIRRDQCDYLSLFMPDLIASPWERYEPHLGYRLARPLYSGPNQMWEKHRLWGSQAYVLSRRFLKAAVERWDNLQYGQDCRVISICSEFRLPMWYSDPCLIQHAPLRTAFSTPPAYAPDFDEEFVFEPSPGFQPPEEVPGWLTLAEGKLLWQFAAGGRVLELGTTAGRATVCLAQQAERVVTVDTLEQTEAREWVRRYGLTERVTFRHGDIAEQCSGLKEQFDLVFVDTEHDATTVARDIEAAMPLLKPGGRLAFHDYPDPGWPEVRRVVDDFARRLGWRRQAQADYLGVFRAG
jgi:SAM-dependent methyltransferase